MFVREHSDLLQIRRDQLVELLREKGELPEKYGRTRVVLVPVEPYLVHVYWELSNKDLERARTWQSNHAGSFQPVLRFYDVTFIAFDGTNSHSYFDIPVDVRTDNWYVHLWSPEKSYVVDLGYRAETGEFYQVARSNCAETPPAWPSPGTDMQRENRPGNKGPGAELRRPAEGSVTTAGPVVGAHERSEAFQTGTSSERDPRIVPGSQKAIGDSDSTRPLGTPSNPKKTQTGSDPGHVHDTSVQRVSQRVWQRPPGRVSDLTDLSEQQFTTTTQTIPSSPGRWGFGGSK